MKVPLVKIDFEIEAEICVDSSTWHYSIENLSWGEKFQYAVSTWLCFFLFFLSVLEVSDEQVALAFESS